MLLTEAGVVLVMVFVRSLSGVAGGGTADEVDLFFQRRILLDFRFVASLPVALVKENILACKIVSRYRASKQYGMQIIYQSQGDC